MRVCLQCDTEYESSATFCNQCNIDFDESNSHEIPDSADQKSLEIIKNARQLIINVHNVLGLIYFIVIGFIVLDKNNLDQGEITIMSFIGFVACLHFFAAYGLHVEGKWGRTMSILLGLVLLIGFPVGTVVGIIILRNMLRNEWQTVDY